MRRKYRDPFPSSLVRPVAARRVSLSLLAVLMISSVMLGMLPAGATGSAETPDPGPDVVDSPTFDVIQISGLIDEIVASFIESAISKAESNHSGGLILQVNSTDAVVSDRRVAELASAIAASEVPVYAWVGPSGAKAEGSVAQLVAVSEEMAVAVGARFGKNRRPCGSRRAAPTGIPVGL